MVEKSSNGGWKVQETSQKRGNMAVETKVFVGHLKG